MNLEERMRESAQRATAPRPGEDYSALKDPNIVSMLRNAIKESEPEDAKSSDIDEPEDMTLDDEDEVLDMHAMANKIAPAVGVSVTGKTESSTPVTTPLAEDKNSSMSDLDDLSLDKKDEDTDEPQNNKLKFIIAGIVFIIILAIVIIFKIKSSSEQQNSSTQSTSTTQQIESNIHKYSNDTLAVTDSQTYQDSMTISKYIEIIDDACLFVFEGYAENARAFVKAYVDIDTYNTYKVGARVPIIYNRITIGNKDYYMKVRLNIS